MDVSNSRSPQRCGQWLAVELRNVARFGDAANIYELFDTVRVEQGYEFLDRTRRMANREQRQLRSRARGAGLVLRGFTPGWHTTLNAAVRTN